jgi:hypothetical protein
MSPECEDLPFDIWAYVRSHRGSAHRIAKACGLCHGMAVWRWRRVPSWHVHAVSQVIGVAPDVLRPDIFNRLSASRAYPLPKWLLATGMVRDVT